MKKVLPGLLVCLTSIILLPAPAFADVPALQVAPLSYQGTLKPGSVESGFVDVANPSGSTIQVNSYVQGFRQIDTKGDLAFYTDPQLSSGITVGLTNFSLGPRQAIRVAFNIDQTKLPQGGIYAAIFFKTVPQSHSSTSSFVLQSANVGTLLILTNGKVGAFQGAITGLSLPFLQLGSGLMGIVSFKNTAGSFRSAGFKPKLTTVILPWGRRATIPSGLILQGVTRDFSFNRSGSYFGLLPVTVSDSVTGAYSTGWVLADTGAYRLGLPAAVLALLLLIALLFRWLPRKEKASGPKTTPKSLNTTDPSSPAALSEEDQSPPVEIDAEPPAPSVLENLTAADIEQDAALDVPEVKKVEVKVSKPPKRRTNPGSSKTKSTKAKKPKPKK